MKQNEAIRLAVDLLVKLANAMEYATWTKVKAAEEIDKVLKVLRPLLDQTSAGVGDDVRDRIEKVLRNHRLSHTQDDDGNGFPLIDALSCKHKTIKEGIEECHSLADEIAAEISALSGSDGRE